jgi:hypothetical protein
MKVGEITLFVGALISGVAAMGCWVLTQRDAAITKQHGLMTFLIMWLATVVSVLLLGGAAFLRSRTQGIRAVVARALFLIGTCGTLVLFLFVVTSKGMVLKLGPLPLILKVAFALSALVFWPRNSAMT